MRDFIGLIIGGLFILLVCVSSITMNNKFNNVDALKAEISRLETELSNKEEQLKIYDVYFEQYSKDSHQG